MCILWMLSLTIPMPIMLYMQQSEFNLKHQCQVEPRQVIVSKPDKFGLIWATCCSLLARLVLLNVECSFGQITIETPLSGSKHSGSVQGAFELISSQCPKAVAGMLDGMARRLSAASAARSNPNQ